MNGLLPQPNAWLFFSRLFASVSSWHSLCLEYALHSPSLRRVVAQTLRHKPCLNSSAVSAHWGQVVLPQPLPGSGGFRDRSIGCLPLPVYPPHLSVFFQTALPQLLEDPRPRPALKVAVQGLARTIPPWHRVPLTARAEDIKNTGHHLAWLGTRTSSNVFAVLAASTQPRFRFRNKGFDSFPETIG